MIRQCTLDDAPGILAIYTPFCKSTATTFEINAPTEEQMKSRIHRINATHIWLVDADHEGVHGYAYASPHRDRPAYRWSVDVSVYVGEKNRGKGLGTKLYTRLFVELRERGFYNAYAGITLPNRASVDLHEKLGFKRIGVYKNVGYKLGKWHDVGWYHLLLRPHDDNPAEPNWAIEGAIKITDEDNLS